VLIAGGANCPTTCAVTNTAEIYDPATGTFTATGSMAFARDFAIATPLSNGTVLEAGGTGNCTPTTPSTCPESLAAEIYNPASGTFSQTGTMIGDAFGEASILLPSGKVLFAGGNRIGTISPVAEIYERGHPVNVTVSTMGRGALFPLDRAPWLPYARVQGFGTVRWILFLIVVAALLAAFHETRRRVPLVISAFFLLALLISGCGSSSYSGGSNSGPTGTPAGTYQLVVSASSSGVTRTTTLTLTVQ
jgi:hypothetical protein